MTTLREGDRVVAVRTIHRSTGSAWSGTKGTIVKIHSPMFVADEITVAFENGFTAERVHPDEIGKI